MPRYNGPLQYNGADIFTCRDCGKIDQGYYVQPQPGGYALCVDCINRINQEYRDRRKAELAAMPRCEVPGCSRRGAMLVAHTTLLCGAHYRRAELGLSHFGIFGMYMEHDKASIVKLASE